MQTEMAKQPDQLFDKELMTAAEVTDFLRVSRRTLDRYVDRGMLRKIKYGGCVRFEKKEVAELLRQKG